MVGVRRLPLVLVVLLIAGASVAGHAFAAQWPAERRFLLVENLDPVNLSPVPASVAEARDGALLVLLWWPVTRTSEDGTVSQTDRTRLVRVAVDGSHSFVPPFGQLVPGSRETRFGIDDEILPLPDGSILFSGYDTLHVRRRDGSITRVAGIGGSGFSGDGGPAMAAELCCVSGLSRRANGSILFGDGPRVRQIALDSTITTVAGTGEFTFSGDGGPATAAHLFSVGDVLATEEGGFLIADAYNGRVRRVGLRLRASALRATSTSRHGASRRRRAHDRRDGCPSFASDGRDATRALRPRLWRASGRPRLSPRARPRRSGSRPRACPTGARARARGVRCVRGRRP